MEPAERGGGVTSETGAAKRRPIVFIASIAVIAAAIVFAFSLPERDGTAGADARRGASRGEIEVESLRSGIVVTPPSIDLGDVFMDVNEVPLEFRIENVGDEVQVITYLETSCDCTTASLIVDGQEGPRFAMRHATPPGSVDWRAVLAPGEELTMMVYYDPQAHGVLTPQEAPQIHGRVTRMVRVHSDDAQRAQVTDVRIDLNQRH